VLKKVFKFIGTVLLILLLGAGIGMYLLTKEKYQNILAQKATKYLSEKLHTKVAIDHVSISFFNKINLNGVYIEDDKKDTLAYIGTLSVNADDALRNYWNDKTQVIHEVSVENAYVNLYRTKKDSIWNYDFLTASNTKKDTSSSTAIDSLKSETASKKASPLFDLKEVTLKNVRFNMIDAWAGEDMKFKVTDLFLQVNTIDLAKKAIDLNKINIDDALVDVKEYQGGKPKKIKDTTDWGTPFNPDGFSVKLKALQLKNSQVVYNDDNDIPKKTQFDEEHIIASAINLDIKNIEVVQDTLFANIEKFSVKERCGLVVKSLKSNIKLSQKQTILSDLLLQTNHSTISNYYELSYRNFHSFNNFIEDVTMKALIKSSSISSLDVGFFANILNKYPIQINVGGDFDGTIDNLKGKNIALSTRNTKFTGDFHIKGLPDVETTLFDVKAKQLKTSGQDLQILIPQLSTNAIAWNKLQQIEYIGDYTGHYNDFTTKGNLNTSLGNAVTNIYLNFKTKQPSYDGYIKTDNLQLGELIKQPTIGALSMDGTIKGSGFDLNNLNATVNATINSFYANKYNYQNIRIDGNVSNKKFEGKLVSKDPNLALNFDGKLDISGKQPIYNFNADFMRFNLQQLGITKEPYIGSANARLNFTGDNIDNFTGDAFLRHIVLENKDRTIYLDSVFLESKKIGNQKSLTLISSAADATLQGQFNISQLANGVMLYLYHYLPSYIQRPKIFSDQQFSYTVKIKEADHLLKIVTPDYYVTDGSTINGSLNTFSQELAINAHIPAFGYKSFTGNEIVITSKGDFNDLKLNVVAGSIYNNNDLIIPSVDINASMAHDTASLTIHTTARDNLVGDAFFTCNATASDNKLYVNILPSKFNIKEDTWEIVSKNEIIIGKNFIDAKNVSIENGAQQINIRTLNSNQVTNAIAEVKNIDIESITGYFEEKPSIYKGRISGTIQAVDVMNFAKVETQLYSETPLIIEKDTLGMLVGELDYDNNLQTLTIKKGTRITRNENDVRIDGDIDFNDKSMDLDASLQNTSIRFLNQYIEDFVSQLNGYATGNVKIQGTFDRPDVNGNFAIKNTTCNVIYLNCKYTIDELKVKINNTKISVEDFEMKDARTKPGVAKVSGYVAHENFDNLYFKFKVRSENILALNTQEWQNSTFYGYVPSKLALDVYGPMDDITMDIDCKPLKGSEFHMPIGGSGDAGKYDYISFVSYGKSQDTEVVKKSTRKDIKINMNIDATQDATAYIILDPNTQEQIIAKGNGNIRLELDMGNSMTMYNTYTISEGKYLFNFRGVIPKEFKIDNGSSIAWNGDPYLAKLNVVAQYACGKVDLYPLVESELSKSTGSDNEKESAQKPYFTFVNIKLTGPLTQPEIKFGITQPDNKDVSSLSYQKFDQITKDDNELVTQAGTLLLIGKFTSPQSFQFGGSDIKGSTASTVGDVLNSALSPVLNNLFSKIGLSNINAKVNYNSYSVNGVDSASTNTSGVNSVGVKLSGNFFNDRVIIDYSNGYDIGKTQDGSRKTAFSGGDFRAQYLITDDGRFRFNAFGNSSNDILRNNSAVPKGGIGLSYKKTFNSLHDLFGINKKVQTTFKKDSIRTEP
jgi:hypothetical protein